MLTNDELSILQAVADGETFKKIAQTRQTTEQMIKNQMCRLYKELGCDNRVHAVVTALRRGLID